MPKLPSLRRSAFSPFAVRGAFRLYRRLGEGMRPGNVVGGGEMHSLGRREGIVSRPGALALGKVLRHGSGRQSRGAKQRRRRRGRLWRAGSGGFRLPFSRSVSGNLRSLMGEGLSWVGKSLLRLRGVILLGFGRCTLLKLLLQLFHYRGFHRGRGGLNKLSHILES